MEANRSDKTTESIVKSAKEGKLCVNASGTICVTNPQFTPPKIGSL